MRRLAFFLGYVLMFASLALSAQSPPPLCTATVFKLTEDSLYAELQAPRGTRNCAVVIREFVP